MSEPVSIENVTCLKETDKALLVEHEGVETWVPKSQVHDDSEVYQEGQAGTLVVSLWLAEEKNWV